MKTPEIIRQLSARLLALSIVLGMSASANAAITINPIELVVDGGYTFNSNVSMTTKLFLDVGGPGDEGQFWVRVEDNPGVPWASTTQRNLSGLMAR